MSIYKLIEKKKREQKKKENLKKAKMAGITVLGASAGALAGILLAPKSGKEIRNDISTKGAEIKNTIVTKSTDIKENISEKVSKRKSDINEAKEKISNYLDKKASDMERFEQPDLQKEYLNRKNVIDSIVTSK